jgi:hypothetical protein
VKLDVTKVGEGIWLYKEVEELYYKGWDKCIGVDMILVFWEDSFGKH